MSQKLNDAEKKYAFIVLPFTAVGIQVWKNLARLQSLYVNGDGLSGHCLLSHGAHF